VVLLPDKRNPEALVLLERSVSAENLEKWSAQMEDREMHVYVPEFEFESEFQLGEVLKSLGMRLAFDPRPGVADRGILGSERT